MVSGILITRSWLPLFVFVFCHLSSWEANEPAAMECDLPQSEISSLSKCICVEPSKNKHTQKSVSKLLITHWLWRIYLDAPISARWRKWLLEKPDCSRRWKEKEMQSNRLLIGQKNKTKTCYSPSLIFPEQMSAELFSTQHLRHWPTPLLASSQWEGRGGASPSDGLQPPQWRHSWVQRISLIFTSV